MITTRFIVVVVWVAMLMVGTGVVCGQTYPSRPVRIVSGSVGSGSDFASRVIAQAISAPLGQPVIVENRSGILSAEAVAKAPPDGYTLLVGTSSIWLSSFFQKIPYDPINDLSPITLVSTAPTVLVVHPSLPAKSTKELISLAKNKPGQLNYASTGIGGVNHLGAALLNAMAKVDIVLVNYKGAGPAIIGLIGGQVQVMFASAGSVAVHMKSGRLRALAVTSAQPFVLLPGLPPVAETVPGYELVTPYEMYATAKTPAAIINRLNQEMVRALNRPDVKEKFLNEGTEPVGSSPEQLAAKVKFEFARWSKVIEEAGIKAE